MRIKMLQHFLIYPKNKQHDYSMFLYWGMVIFIVFLMAAIRIKLLNVPLERDEGEFAYMGQLILQGIPPYLLAYSMKLPGIYAAYALIMGILGETPQGIHLGLLFINALTIVALFLLTRRLFDACAGVIACATYGILSLSPTVLGISAHATHFVVLPAIFGILLLLKAIDTGKSNQFFWSGLLLGLAFIMKQSGIFFVIFTALYLLRCQFRERPIQWARYFRQSALFSIGVVIPFGLVCLILYGAGVYNKFWFWTFTYAREYVSEESFTDGLLRFLYMAKTVIGPSPVLWLFAFIGLSVPFWNKRGRLHIFFIESFFIFSFLAICPGFYFRNHYFILVLPVVALLTGIAVSSSHELLLKFKSKFPIHWIPLFIFLMAFSFAVIKHKIFFFELTPCQASRFMYRTILQPFCESLEVAQYIKAHTSKNDRIAVIGSEPQIYFYSDRLSATGYIYTYRLMAEQPYALKMQEEMIHEIESSQPQYLIFIQVHKSWLVRPNSNMLIFNWFKKYEQNYFDLVGIIDIISPYKTVYRWDSEVRGYYPRSENVMYVFKRKVAS